MKRVCLFCGSSAGARPVYAAAAEAFGRALAARGLCLVYGGGSVGLGFAIPVDLAVRLAGELIAQGRVNHPTFGFEGHVLSPEAAAATGLPQGVFVRRVVAGGPAADAGLRAGDVIVEIDGRPARSADAVVLAVLTRGAGDVVDVTYVRDGVTKQTEVTTGDSVR